MKVIPETRRAHYIRYLRFHYLSEQFVIKICHQWLQTMILLMHKVKELNALFIFALLYKGVGSIQPHRWFNG